MKHNLLIMEICVDRFRPCLPMSDIESTSKTGEANKYGNSFNIKQDGGELIFGVKE